MFVLEHSNLLCLYFYGLTVMTLKVEEMIVSFTGLLVSLTSLYNGLWKRQKTSDFLILLGV